MASRYELSEAQWERIRGTLPRLLGHVGRTAADNRQFVNGVPWVLRSGAGWHDLPERYGKYKSVHTRCMGWARAGGVGAHLRRPGRGEAQPVPEDRLDPRPGSSAGRSGPQERGSGDKALERSRGGLSTKIHLLAGENGLPVDFRIRPGQAAEYAQAIHLLKGQQARAVIADKGHDSAEIAAAVKALGAVAVIPLRRHWKQPRGYDRELYKQRDRIERCFNRLKQFRRFSTRCCRTIEAFRSCAALACAWLRLELYVDTALAHRRDGAVCRAICRLGITGHTRYRRFRMEGA